MKPLVILFNGPPRCGKDTAVNFVHHDINDKYAINDHLITVNSAVMKFAEPLRIATQAFIAPLVLGNAQMMVPVEWEKQLDKIKDEPMFDDLGDLTVRDVMISLSEDWAKDFLGQAVFGRILAAKIKALTTPQKLNVFLVSDSGFEVEAQALQDIDVEIKIIQMFREGCDFHNDSRSYVFLDDVDIYELHNNRDIFSLRADALSLVRGIIYDHTTAELARLKAEAAAEEDKANTTS